MRPYLPTLPVQNLVDNEGTSSSAPANSPDWDMLAKFQPEDICEPASFLENCMFIGVGLLALAVWLLVGWIIWG